MVTYTVLLALMPCTWISYIWDQVILLPNNILLINIIMFNIQIIDPEFDLENIEQPDNWLINAFYQVAFIHHHQNCNNFDDSHIGQHHMMMVIMTSIMISIMISFMINIMISIMISFMMMVR